MTKQKNEVGKCTATEPIVVNITHAECIEQARMKFIIIFIAFLDKLIYFCNK